MPGTELLGNYLVSEWFLSIQQAAPASGMLVSNRFPGPWSTPLGWGIGTCILSSSLELPCVFCYNMLFMNGQYMLLVLKGSQGKAPTRAHIPISWTPSPGAGPATRCL